MPDDDKSIPEWALIVWKMKAELQALDHRIQKIDHRIQKMENAWEAAWLNKK